MRIIFSILLVIACALPTFAQTAQKAQQKATLVTVATITEGVVNPTIDVTGAAFFADASNVASENSGKVAKVYVNEGDLVKQGDTLAELDTTILDFNINASTAKAKLAKLLEEKAKRDFARNEVLFKQNSISAQKYQDSLTEFEVAVFTFLASKADEQRLLMEKEKTIVKAPFDGIVTSKNVSAGEWLSAGGTVAHIGGVTFESKIYLPEKVMPYIKVGATIPVLTEIGELQGKILSVNTKGDAATRTFLTRISIGSNPYFREGIITTARVPAGKPELSMLVPRDAVAERNNEKGIFKVLDDNIVRFVPVAVLGYSGSMTAIKTAGATVGDKIVITGNNLINSGSKITTAAK